MSRQTERGSGRTPYTHPSLKYVLRREGNTYTLLLILNPYLTKMPYRQNKFIESKEKAEQ